MTDRPRLLLLSGQLGAGKTTFARHFLTRLMEPGARAHLVVNEIGKSNVDAAVLARHGGEVLKLLAGCLCCSGKQDLFEGLRRLLDPSRGPLPHWVVIESSGLADPADTVDALLHPALAAAADLAAAVTVVDCARFAAAAKPGDLLERQVRYASLVLANKSAGLDEAARLETKARLEGINPVARLAWTEDAALRPEEWAQALAAPALPQPQPLGFSRPISYRGWHSLDWAVLGTPSRGEVEAAMAALPEGVERVKGYLQLREGGCVLVQKAGSAVRLHDWEREEALPPQLTLIGSPLNREAALAALALLGPGREIDMA